MELSEAWKKEAERWALWARAGHDSYQKFHRNQFIELLPPPGAMIVDVGCGEGRLARDLNPLGYNNLMSFDISETLIKLAKKADPAGYYAVANAAEIPLADGCADLVIAFMSLHDIDELDRSISEMARILKRHGRACIAIVHPMNSAGRFISGDGNSEFVIKGSYLDEFQYSDELTRDGMTVTFHSRHRPLVQYSRALEKAGLLIEAIREHRVPESAADPDMSKRWQRLPLFLHIRAIKLAELMNVDDAS